MSPKHDTAKADILDKLAAMVCDRLAADQAASAEEFLRAFFAGISEDDLLSLDIQDLYGAALSEWHFLSHRDPGQPKVRVYNPQIEEHGWQSTHTVIAVVCDDMPFLVDSVRMAISRLGLGIHLLLHPVLRLRRDDRGRLLGLDADGAAEAVMHIQVDRRTDSGLLHQIHDQILDVRGQVRLVVDDWPRMRDRVHQVSSEIETRPPPVDEDELRETRAFLAWMNDHHFTLLGFREYEWTADAEGGRLQALPDSSLGILRRPRGESLDEVFDRLPADPHCTPSLLMITKTSQRATVHRDAYMDYVGVKRYDAEGGITGEYRFVGLFTAAAYIRPPRDIPLLRRRVANVLARAGFPPDSHSGKLLSHILDTYPRDDLFQIDEQQLLDQALTILDLEGRQRIRLLPRRDPFGRYFSCIVYIPRDRMDTRLRRRIEGILREALGGISVDYSLNLTDALLARLQFVVHVKPGAETEPEVKVLEQRIAEAARSWVDELESALHEHFGEEHGNRHFERYRDAFPVAYREDFPVRMAALDIEKIEQLGDPDSLGMSLYQPLEAPENVLHFKLIRRAQVIPLSDALPMLENMGVRVVRERPYKVQPEAGVPAWIHDFGMRQRDDGELDTGDVREIFQETFARVWDGDTESDGLNRLVLSAGLSWREIAVLRAYTRYLQQAGSSFSQTYMKEALTDNPHIARLLVELFRARFDPVRRKGASGRTSRMVAHVLEALEAVASLDADRILRRFLDLIQATLRTNYYQHAEAQPKPYLSLKLDTAVIPELPEPRPAYEIFVYSPRVEGVHLRGGKVARGGLRWSDRREDFRTEVLGLMKAQMVKNAIIVPVGAKGGFVLKQAPPAGDREALMQEVVACYQTFVRGLLDLTDNLVSDHVKPPKAVVRYDDDDPYLVVAADKGTATFSDVANAISAEYGFWLGDAFASGGATGYDHKAMGITARGAWVSVMRHFRELGLDVQTEPVAAIGIGDMSGDVFGNGMLQSRQLRLLAAFDHRHIFVDPDPDPDTSYRERQRLFALPRSSWADYDPALISAGGGVFPRTAKSVQLSPQLREVLDIQAEALTPNDLIHAILKAPVDLLWNGGIGTFAKASHESHTETGDRANDATRVNARELRCRVIGEGGNLGLTQLARIEFAHHGGRVNTDAIDNSGGVACSDHEVNIKVLLDRIVANGDLTLKQRNQLLEEMTDEVADLVLQENHWQNQILSLTEARAAELLPEHTRFIRSLERAGTLNRALEYLPDDEAIAERLSARQGLTRPELSVLLAYAKLVISDALAGSDLPDDPHFSAELERYFPRPLRERFAAEVRHHRLRRDLIATFVTNRMVNRLGPTFAFRIQEDSGADIPSTVRAYTAAWHAFGATSYWSAVTQLGRELPMETLNRLLTASTQLLERATVWLLRHRGQPLDVADTTRQFAAGIETLASKLPDLLNNEPAAEQLIEAGVPPDLATRMVGLHTLYSALDIVEVANTAGVAVEQVAGIYFSMGGELKLDWLRDQIAALPADTPWASRARDALSDDLLHQQRALTVHVLRTGAEAGLETPSIQPWIGGRVTQVRHWLDLVADLGTSVPLDLAMCNVALRDLRALIAAGA